MAERHCPACGARHAVNAHRCRACGTRLGEDSLVDAPPLMHLSTPLLPRERALAAWLVVMGSRPSRSQRRKLEEHPKFDHLARWDVPALVESGQQAVVDGGIDVDLWVGAALRKSAAGPAREPIDLEAERAAFREPPPPPEPEKRQPGRSTSRLGVGLVVLVLLAVLVVAFLAQHLTSSGTSSKHAGETVTVTRITNDPTDTDVVKAVRDEFCGQGYAEIRLTIVRAQPNTSTTTVERCSTGGG